MDIRGLECRIGRGRVVLPTTFVDLLGEYSVGTRIPVSDLVGCAIGVWTDEPILSISLSRHEPAPIRTTNGALLLAAKAVIRWAFEIDEPIGIVSIASMAKPTATIPWRRSAMLSDGRSLQFIDIPMMIEDLGGRV